MKAPFCFSWMLIYRMFTQLEYQPKNPSHPSALSHYRCLHPESKGWRFWLVRQKPTGPVWKLLCSKRALMSPVGPTVAATIWQPSTQAPAQPQQSQVFTGSLGPVIISSSSCFELTSSNWGVTGSCSWKAHLGSFQDCFHGFSHLGCAAWFQLLWRRAVLETAVLETAPGSVWDARSG